MFTQNLDEKAMFVFGVFSTKGLYFLSNAEDIESAHNEVAAAITGSAVNPRFTLLAVDGKSVEATTWNTFSWENRFPEFPLVKEAKC